ncbi:uncharacterized protein BP01DRAFT_299882 [Aspergillus saccharolyticus JOP 1030-1]|uniref:CorA-like transporter domain-containing protein n=1 Tax=Aspergillus saccharolyticus JOP 1030-1 TaxID=1450539 RepID=A0A318Z9B6_9EURO|nr:hypothetical protein BP01DRAFT_299882 [Aspergillus saccharolyticus JOP 1030-1]PYH43991.1 hypothetical protein BP01DRAFT_299882 [Aspergillus saccharolyticus JOP 1030-1]
MNLSESWPNAVPLLSPTIPSYYESTRPYHHDRAFVTKPEKADIHLFDKGAIPSELHFNHSDAFERHIATTPKPRFRVVLISSAKSVCPLGITEPAFHRLLDQYDIDRSFRGLCLTFGDKPKHADAGRGAMRILRHSNGIIDLHYLLSYPEDDLKSATAPDWTIRQVEVFQRIDPANAENLWIILSARRKSRLQQALDAFMQASTTNHALADWSILPRLVFTTYMSNWRWYIASLGAKIDKAVRWSPAKIYGMRRSDDQRAFSVLKPQSLGDQLAPLCAWLTVALRTVQQLRRVNEILHQYHGLDGRYYRSLDVELLMQEADLTSCVDSVQVLEKKIQSIANMQSVILNLNYQDVAAQVNSQMLKLGTESFDDSSTVKSMTLVTLIYLPASFVSSILGMNLFDFDGGDEKNGGFTISNQFWIFVVIAVPLTLLTLLSWYLFTRRTKKARARLTNGPHSFAQDENPMQQVESWVS